MSENTVEPKQTNKSQDSSTEKKEPSRKSLFGNLNLNQDLKKALNSWDSVSETVQKKVSPADEQMKEVKKLLGELKTKLSEFE